MSVTEETPRRIDTPDALAGPLCPCLSVAILTGFGDFHAPPPRIKGVVGPLDFAALSHSVLLCPPTKESHVPRLLANLYNRRFVIEIMATSLLPFVSKALQRELCGCGYCVCR